MQRDTIPSLLGFSALLSSRQTKASPFAEGATATLVNVSGRVGHLGLP